MSIRCVLVLSLLFLTTLSQAGLDNIAVNDLGGQGVDQSSATIITDRLRTELFKTGAFNVLERQAMQDILKEQGFQQAGCVSDQCMVEMGQLLGVTRFVAGTVGKLGNIFTFNIRVVEVATGKIVFTESIDCDCTIDKVLTMSTPAIARKIAASTRETVQPVERPSPVKAPEPAKGSLAVKSAPPGARVMLDSAQAGHTPYIADSLMHGPRILQLDMDGYEPVKTSINIEPGNRTDLSYTLKHTRAYTDSVRAAEKAARNARQAVKSTTADNKKKHKLPPAVKIILGVAAAGCAGGGVAVNYLVNTKVQEDSRLKGEYAEQIDDAQYDTYQAQITENADAARQMEIVRNALYIGAGVLAVGFGVSFAF